ncbi:hypothetical protein J2735_003321 [Agrobacterium tumefaciens]|nr:hypothetical protein [Agrobacterium tumefaciens]
MCVKGEIGAQSASGRVRTLHTRRADGADLERIERPQRGDVSNPGAPSSLRLVSLFWHRQPGTRFPGPRSRSGVGTVASP